jgi:hypothetical protein
MQLTDVQNVLVFRSPFPAVLLGEWFARRFGG